jgi:hypothetical protein
LLEIVLITQERLSVKVINDDANRLNPDKNFRFLAAIVLEMSNGRCTMNQEEIAFEHDTKWTQLFDLMVDTGMFSVWTDDGVRPEDDEKRPGNGL